MSATGKPVLAVDVDEVLAYFIPSLAEFHNEAYPTDNELTADSFHSYDFCKVWGGTPEDSYSKMDAFYASRHFQETLRPIPHAIDILQELKQDYELHVVTSRQFAIQERTLQWIETHYPNIFTEIHFGNHYSREGKVRSKPEICRDIGAVLLIDDSLQYAYQCHTANIPVVLFGEYAWNQKHSVHPALFKDGDVAIHKFDRELHTTDIERDMDLSSALYRVHDWRHMKEAIDYILHRHRVITPAATDADTPVGAAVAGRLRVAAIQMCSVDNKLKNIQTIARLVRRAVAEGLGAELVCLPECCTFMGLNGDQTVAAAEPIIRADVYPQVRCKYDWRAALPEEYDGWSDINCTAALCEIAHTSHVWLSVGGFAESRTIDGVARMSNTHFLISPQGQVLESSLYRKIHLFDAPLVGLQESRTTVPGDKVVRVDVADWSVGMSLCYDLRFPELYQQLRRPSDAAADKASSSAHAEGNCARGAELLLVPAAFTPRTGEPHWEILLRARAIETQCYIIAAAQAGQHNEKRKSHGHTMVVNPWGTVVSHLEGDAEGVCYAAIDRSSLETIRSSMPVQAHKRGDLFSF